MFVTQSSYPPIEARHFYSVLPHPSVRLLREPGSESGYRHVYRTHAGAERWCAKVRARGRLTRIKGSASALPHQAALYAVRWYQDRYGAAWAQTIEQGRGAGGQAPVKVRAVPGGGFAVRVWEFGRAVELSGTRHPDRRHEDGFDSVGRNGNCRLARPSWRCPGRILVFATRAEALAAADLWARWRWGLFAEACVWRW